MATSVNTSTLIPYISSGVYFREIDLTVVTQATGGFSAAAIGLTEKGPAFQITNSATYTQRAFTLGDLNPDYPMSYYARQYLQQANNYKEVRLLGLEGYTDTQGWGVVYALGGAAANVPNVSPLVVPANGLAAVLKERPTSLTGRPSISTVQIQTSTYLDPSSGLSVTAASDYQFNILVTYVDSTTDLITCSLRPESPNYILTKLWSVPFDHNPDGDLIFPLLKTSVITLWVDFLLPSNQTRPDLNHNYGYYLPGSSVANSTLPLLTGNIAFGTQFNYNPVPITNVVAKVSSGNVIGCTVTATGDLVSQWAGQQVPAVTISNVTGTGNITLANGTWAVTNIIYNAPSTSFDLNDLTQAENDVIAPLTTITSNSTFSNTGSPTAAEYLIPTWQSQVLNFAGVIYQTPITPWFVSDGDASGDFQRLFRFWSISDGRSADTFIKIEINSIDPTGNNGNGAFTVVVRDYSDAEDVSVNALETWANVNMDPTSANYILRRIGNGEDFALRSKYIFVEMNTNEQIPATALPYGVLGYPNATGNVFEDVIWTTAYDLTKPITKQRLGLANNSINMFAEVAEGQLALKNNTTTVGLGFHLNPKNNATFVTDQSSTFNFANQSIYKDVNGNPLTPQNVKAVSQYVVDFAGGFDGWNVYKERSFGDTSSMDYQSLQMGLTVLADKESIDADFTVLTTPDFYLDTDAEACNAVLEMCQNRGDCLYIPDFSYDAAADTNNAVSLLQSSSMMTNQTAVYFPWLQIQDDLNKINEWLPPSILALGTITYVATAQQVWQPPGGSIRTVTNNLVRSRRRLVQADREVLKGASINPITLFPGSGYEITEVRTTQQDFSALSFIHNRLLLCYAKKTLNQILRPLLFLLNNQVTKDAFISTVTPIFDRIKKLNGIDDFSVTVDTTDELNDPTTLHGIITIIPLYPVESIVVDFVLQDSGVSFNQ
jgi:hypothetical protein